MKKSLLKASLICLGATLLCGLYSFMVPERVKLQQSCQTVTVSNDTIITSEGEDSECMKEVVEGDNGGCICSIYVETKQNGSWELYLEVLGELRNGVQVEGDYYVVTGNGRDDIHINRIIKDNDKHKLNFGSANTVCVVNSLDPCFLK